MSVKINFRKKFIKKFVKTKSGINFCIVKSIKREGKLIISLREVSQKWKGIKANLIIIETFIIDLNKTLCKIRKFKLLKKNSDEEKD